MTKAIERGVARQLRAELGEPIKEIASTVGVSQGTVSSWVRDIVLTPEQRSRNLSRSGTVRGEAWRKRNREIRRGYQEEGRRRARAREPLHLAGCMLYWAEGSKDRNSAALANSDPHMLRFFAGFLREEMGVGDSDLSIRLNVYLGNGLSLQQIESHWLRVLSLPREALRKHSIDHFPTSSSGLRRSLPYGVCTLRVLRSTRIVQHIYGAIQAYGSFEEQRWLDGAYER